MDEQIHRGLEDITVANSRLSSIDGETGELLISGFPVSELAPRASYEECVYLLLHDRLPTASELATFRRELAERRPIPGEAEAVLERAAAEEASAMDALRMGAATASLGANDGDPEADAIRAIAVFPTIVSTFWRYRQEMEPISPDPDLGHTANLLYMLTGNRPDESTIRGLETYLNTVIDHGLNASTFTARVIVSSESDLLSAATGAIGTLKGPLHGGAPGPVLEMLQEVHETGAPAEYVRERLDAGERLIGFGHRVYRVRDPRATVLQSTPEDFYDERDDNGFFESAQAFEREAVDFLTEHKPELSLETNVEFYTAVLLHGVGIPRPLFSAMFAVSRVGGWMAHALEQLDDNRIIRPRGRYVGDNDRVWIELEER